jgi:hypothetical protein
VTALTEAPDLYELPTDPEARANWRIEHEGQAVWAARKLAEAEQARQERMAEVRKIYEEEKARLDAWLSKQENETERAIDQFMGYLKDYAMRVRIASGGERKFVDTPHYRVSTMTTGGAWDVSDKTAAIQWAKKNRPELVKTEEKFLLAEAKKALSVAGDRPFDPSTKEVLGWATVAPARVSVSFEAHKGGRP